MQAQLEGLIGRELPLSLYVTRIELDAVSGLGGVVGNFNVTNIFASSGFNTNPLEFFDDLRGSSLTIERRQHGECVALSAGRELEVIQPVLRLLPTSWAFDHATGTLFTSDAFAHVQAAPSDGVPSPEARRVTADAGTALDVAAHLFVKFEWLRQLPEPESTYIADGVARVFEDYDVATIAPTHGCVIHGRELVQRHKDWLLKAILEGPPGARE